MLYPYFYATVNFITTKKRVYWLIIAIVAGATIASGYGIAQHLGFDMFKWSSFEARRVFSTFGNPVFFLCLPRHDPASGRCLVFEGFFPANRRAGFEKFQKVACFMGLFIIASIIYTAFWLTNTRACFVALIGGLTPFLF